MSGVYPIALLTTTMTVWLMTSVCAHRLLRRFCDRFPAIAEKEIRFAFDPWIRHPEKLIFFFRRRAAELMRADPLLLRSRQRLIGLCVLSALVPLVGFTTIAVVAFTHIYN